MNLVVRIELPLGFEELEGFKKEPYFFAIFEQFELDCSSLAELFDFEPSFVVDFVTFVAFDCSKLSVADLSFVDLPFFADLV